MKKKTPKNYIIYISFFSSVALTLENSLGRDFTLSFALHTFLWRRAQFREREGACVYVRKKEKGGGGKDAYTELVWPETELPLAD